MNIYVLRFRLMVKFKEVVLYLLSVIEIKITIAKTYSVVIFIRQIIYKSVNYITRLYNTESNRYIVFEFMFLSIHMNEKVIENACF